MKLITITLLALVAFVDSAHAEESVPSHTTLTPGFGGGWFHARGSYGSGMLLQAKLERATGGRLEWQADYAISDWSQKRGGATWQRLGGGINYAVGHLQMDRDKGLFDVTIGVGLGLQMIGFDDGVSLARADIAIALGLRELFEMNTRSRDGKHVWYGLSADVRLIASPTPDGLDLGIMTAFGMTIGR